MGETQGAVVSIQMTPFSTLSNRLYKTVRESAKATGKKVRLLSDGSTLEMDSHIWNVLVDALMHLLRNCVDHGVEMSTQRQLAGKPEQGTIRISCFRQGSRFVLRLSDDGAGLDYDAIRNKARDLYSDSDVALMDDAALAALIFKPGFSVRSEVTSMSGRGVGMDVVRNALDQLNGAIEVSASQGEGTEFVLSMPIAVAQLPALMVMFGEQQFAVPMRDVTSVLRLSAEELTKNTFEVDDESFPLLRPAEILRLKPPVASSERRNGASRSSLAFAVETFGRRGIMVADAIIGQKTVVFKNLGSHLQSTPCVAGVTIMGDGSLVPILQTEDLFNRVESVDSQTDRSASSAGDAGKVLDILIADDSISVRKVLGNFITSQGWHPIVAHDGADAMVKIKEKTPDLIILDIEMPNMNGFEVLQALQSQTAYRDIPVLMLTSRSADKYKEKAAGLGARGFVTKPFKNAELISLISGLTSQTPQKDSEQ
ncbi:MAG: response regulator [Desulfocapsa sp.]|nr:response regulator [Desulfocapsa sp.]